RNLRGFATGRSTAFVVQYPEERVDHADAFRGMPVLVGLESGLPRCVACGLCEFACPTNCISIVSGELPDHAIERYPEQFQIDMSRCMFCGLCEEACPEEAIVMSREVEIAAFDRDSLIYEKEQRKRRAEWKTTTHRSCAGCSRLTRRPCWPRMPVSVTPRRVSLPIVWSRS
ncbi:MAG: NADH-quinone oxidoreductase subunit I, partial [Deltaproteobacteria bacterium]|nr:NADH-quinone oxidoreductase subunit I [Deltaproteobacteria bacterium]